MTKIELVTSRIISTMSISTCHFFLSIFTQNIDFSAIPFSFFDTEVLSLEPELVNIKWNLATLFNLRRFEYKFVSCCETNCPPQLENYITTAQSSHKKNIWFDCVNIFMATKSNKQSQGLSNLTKHKSKQTEFTAHLGPKEISAAIQLN